MHSNCCVKIVQLLVCATLSNEILLGLTGLCLVCFHRLLNRHVSLKLSTIFPFRFWWILGIMISIYLSSTAILGLKQQWDETPVIALGDAKLLSIGTLPFPAITLCPRPAISAHKFNFTKEYLSILLQHDILSSQNMRDET